MSVYLSTQWSCKGKRFLIKDNIISVYSFYISCYQIYKSINKLEPFVEFCSNPSIFQMKSLYSCYNSIFRGPDYLLVGDLKNNINVKSSNIQEKLFPGLLGREGAGSEFFLIWSRLQWTSKVTQDGYFYFLWNATLNKVWRLNTILAEMDRLERVQRSATNMIKGPGSCHIMKG